MSATATAKAKPKPKSSGRKPRCPNGTRRSRKTGNCEPAKRKPKTAKRKSLKPKMPRQSKRGRASKPRPCPKRSFRKRRSGKCRPKAQTTTSCSKIKVPLGRSNPSKPPEAMLPGDTLLGFGTFGITVSRRIGGELKVIKLIEKKYTPNEFRLQHKAASVTPYVADVESHCSIGPGQGLVVMNMKVPGKINGEGWTRASCRRAVRQLLMGVLAMHKHDIYHFDMSEDNIMFDRDPVANPKTFNLKIIDFGQARQSTDPYYTFVGNVPPEQINELHTSLAAQLPGGRPALFAAHDTWGVAILLNSADGRTDKDLEYFDSFDDYITEFKKAAQLDALDSDDSDYEEQITRSCDPSCQLAAYTASLKPHRVAYNKIRHLRRKKSNCDFARPLYLEMLEPNVFRRAKLSAVLDHLDSY